MVALSGLPPRSQDDGDADLPPGRPGARYSLLTRLSSTITVSWADRALEIQVGLSRPPAPQVLSPADPALRPYPGSVSFWTSLSPGEQQAFRAVADKRVFAAGARLMQEGEHANHVAVILDGWTEIRVREHDGERVVARRGPGQLVGERAALQVSVRSATVVAIQPVEALVMPTEDFAAFVSDHPGVLDIVENQIFSRLRERTTAGWVAPGRPDNRARPASPRPRRRLTGENCTVLRTDVVAFSAEDRNDEDRAIIRRATMAMTHQALGTTRDLCWCEDRGDGHLIVAPPSIPTARAMQGLLAGLVRELRRHNRIYSNSIQVRLRVAVDVGPVTEDVSGVSGKAIITASRMLDAPAFKEAMAEDGAVLGVVVSPFVYENAIRQGADPSTVTGYRKIMVEVKETRAPAWIHLIAGQLGQVQLATSGASSPCSRV